MIGDDLIHSLIPVLTKSWMKQDFNIFDVMHHGTHEKQLSNIFSWLLQRDQTHELEDAFIQIFINEINTSLERPIEIEDFDVYQEANTSQANEDKDIADIVLDGKKTVIVVENYYTSSGHGHSYDKYYEYGTRDNKRCVVVILCEVIDDSLQTDGWEKAPVLTYFNLISKLFLKVSNDANYQHNYPLQYGFIKQMEGYFVKGKQVNDVSSVDFINVLLTGGECKLFGKTDSDKAINDFSEHLKEETIYRYNEGRLLLNRVKSNLRLYADTTLKQKMNVAAVIFDTATIEYKGIYQWCVNLRKDAELILQIKFGPSAYYANEEDKDWKIKVENADYSYIFIANSKTAEIRQSTITLHEFLDGLSPDDNRLCDELLSLYKDQCIKKEIGV